MGKHYELNKPFVAICSFQEGSEDAVVSSGTTPNEAFNQINPDKMFDLMSDNDKLKAVLNGYFIVKIFILDNDDGETFIDERRVYL